MLPPGSSQFRKFWTEDRIDRSFAVNSHRLMIGLHVDSCWTGASGSLFVGSGRGKFLQGIHSSEMHTDFDSPLRDRALNAAGNPSATLANILQVQQEIAEALAPLVKQMVGVAGKYVDRILGVTVTEPGFWRTDFDGDRLHCAALDPARLAELTGLSVIDDFSSRDLAAGGNGLHWREMPLWFTLADRRTRGALGNVAVVWFDNDSTTLYLLPGSDGLDEIQPEIVASQFEGKLPTGELAESIVGSMESLTSRNELSFSEIHLLNDDSYKPGPVTILANRLVEMTGGVREEPAANWPFASADQPNRILLVDQKPRQLQVVVHTLSGRTLSASLTAIAGLIHADLMPLNVPSITGAEGLRQLGRLTPGKPFSFRHLLASMTDARSAPMRLRDAI